MRAFLFHVSLRSRGSVYSLPRIINGVYTVSQVVSPAAVLCNEDIEIQTNKKSVQNSNRGELFPPLLILYTLLIPVHRHIKVTPSLVPLSCWCCSLKFIIQLLLFTVNYIICYLWAEYLVAFQWLSPVHSDGGGPPQSEPARLLDQSVSVSLCIRT